MGILMRGVKRDDVKRGMIVAKPGSLKQYDRFKAQIYMMTKEEGGREKPLTNGIQECKCPPQTEPCSCEQQSNSLQGFYFPLNFACNQFWQNLNLQICHFYNFRDTQIRILVNLGLVKWLKLTKIKIQIL